MPTNYPAFQSSDLTQWAKAAAKSAPGGEVNALNWQTPDGISVKPLYTAADTQDLPYTDTLPGFEPYLRGPQATMYAVRPGRSGNTPAFPPQKSPTRSTARRWLPAGRA
jgi:methylmalonyl-CoA mutase